MKPAFKTYPKVYVKRPTLWLVFGSDDQIADREGVSSLYLERPSQELLREWDKVRGMLAPHYSVRYLPHD
jgi:hypothetical protein